MNDRPEDLVSAGAPLSRRLSGAHEAAAQPPAAHKLIVIDAQAVPLAPRTAAADYAALDADFRSHHATNATRRRGPYEHYRLIYRYGYDLGTDPRYRTAAWADVEREARPRWEERNPGTWAPFQETIWYAWDQARQFAEAVR